MGTSRIYFRWVCAVGGKTYQSAAFLKRALIDVTEVNIMVALVVRVECDAVRGTQFGIPLLQIDDQRRLLDGSFVFEGEQFAVLLKQEQVVFTRSTGECNRPIELQSLKSDSDPKRWRRRRRSGQT